MAVDLEEDLEAGQEFDFEVLRRRRILMPPTREDICRLLEMNEYNDEMFLITANYNSKKKKPGSGGGRERRMNINHRRIENILTDEFKLHKLQSNPRQPYTNSRGVYLARICGDRNEQRRRVRKLCSQIRQRLLTDLSLNIDKAHVIGSLVFYYGDAENVPNAYNAGDAEDTPIAQMSDNDDILDCIRRLYPTPSPEPH